MFLFDFFERLLSAVSNANNKFRAKLYMHSVILKFMFFERQKQRKNLEKTIAKKKYVVTKMRKQHENYATMLNIFEFMLNIRYKRIKK